MTRTPTMRCSRRGFLAAAPAARAWGQSGHEHHRALYERLQQPGRIDTAPSWPRSRP